MQAKNLRVVKILLGFGASINSLNCQGRTPLDIAVEYNYEDVVILLQSLGAVQGELARRCSFGAALPQLKTLHDPANNKSRLRELRLRRRTCKEENSNGSSATVNGERGVVSAATNGDGDEDDAHAKVKFSDAVEVNYYLNGSSTVEKQADDEKLQTNENGLEANFRQRSWSNQSLNSIRLKDMEDGKSLSTLYERIQQCVNITLELSGEREIPFLLNCN